MMKKVVSIILVLILLSTWAVYSIAANVSELQDKLDDVEKEKEAVSAEKDGVLDEISELNAQISQYESEIDELNERISKLESNIKKNEKEIVKLEKEAKEKEELLLQRLVAMYEAGQPTYLDILLSSEDITSYYLIIIVLKK